MTLSTAHLLLEDVARVRPGDRLLIHSAAGGMGLALAALARRYDPAELIGSVGDASKLAAAKAAGYDQVFVRGDGLVPAVRDATGGRGANVILGALGTQGLADDIAMAAAMGRIVRFGNAPGLPTAPLPVFGDLGAANISIAGFSRRALARREPARVRASFADMVLLLAAGQINVEVTEIAGLEAVPAVLAAMADGGTTGKFVVRIGAST